MSLHALWGSKTWQLVRFPLIAFFSSTCLYSVLLIVWSALFITPQINEGLRQPVTIGLGSIRFFTFTPTVDGASYYIPFEAAFLAALVTALVVFVVQVMRSRR